MEHVITLTRSKSVTAFPMAMTKEALAYICSLVKSGINLSYDVK